MANINKTNEKNRKQKNLYDNSFGYEQGKMFIKKFRLGNRIIKYYQDHVIPF